MTVTIEVMRLRDVLSVCERMRPADWVEVMNTLPRSITTPDVVAMYCMQASKIGFVAYLDDRPAMVAQIAEILDGSIRIGMFGTEDFKAVCMPMVRHLVTNVVPYLIEDGAIYCDALADELHPEAHKLLEFIGFQKRATLPGFGSRGRDIALYVLTKGEADVLRNGRWRKLRQQHSTDKPAGNSGD